MRESPITLTPTVQLDLTIDPTGQYPLAAISELLAKQNITSMLVESLVESLNDLLVKSICGENTLTATETNDFNALRRVLARR
jgi:hypothetical protein